MINDLAESGGEVATLLRNKDCSSCNKAAKTVEDVAEIAGIVQRLKQLYPLLNDFDNLAILLNKAGIDNLADPVIAGTINQLSQQRKLQFFNDLAQEGTHANHISNNISTLTTTQVRGWNEAIERGVSTGLSKNSRFLESYGKLIDDDDLIEHIFIGNIQNVSGCHYRPAVNGVNIRFVDNQIPEGNSLGVLKGDIEMKRELLKPGGISFNPKEYRWKRKNNYGEPQTFFPSTWTQDEILEQCASALANPNKQLVPGKSKMWVAESDSGVFIRWIEQDGLVASIFPEF